MRLHTKTVLGIDIGERRISVALVERDEQGVRTVAAANADLPAGGAGQQESSHGKVLSRLLSQLGRRSQIRRARAAVALSVDSMVTQLLDLPKHMPANIGEFVKSELQQYVALSGKNVVSDFCGVGSGVQKRLLAVAADVDEIQEIVDECREAGIAVDVVEPSMRAYTRAFLEQRRQSRHDGDVMIAMLGPRTLTVNLFLRGTLDFVRVRDLPSDASTPPSLCAWLAEELRAVDRYYEAQTTGAGRDWQTCVVLGDGEHRAEEIEALLAAEAGITSLTVVEAWEPWPGSASTKEEKVSTAAVGAALALLGPAGTDLKINLLPKSVTEARSRSQHLVATALVSVIVFLGIFATTVFLTRTTSAMDRRIEQTRLSEELYAAPALIAEEKFLDQEMSRIRLRLDPLRKAMAGRHEADWPGILDAVRQAAPANVSITQLLCGDGKTLSLKGLTPSCPAAETFVRNLESQRPFESISLALVRRQQDAAGRLEYRIDCLLKTKARVEGVPPSSRGQDARDTGMPSERGRDAPDTAKGGKSS
ncbi:MAG: pilus assembly protein PilM [Phycisphaerae bacterium]|nr:pilus assembly protein PilM [Phycisphaerae bacterium]